MQRKRCTETMVPGKNILNVGRKILISYFIRLLEWCKMIFSLVTGFSYESAMGFMLIDVVVM